MPKLSVFVTTLDNERTLPACLESVRWADEIVLLDSYSSDATLEIAERYGCRISQHAFQGYGPQKRMAMELTTNDWVLLLDADEALTPALQEEIRALLATEPAVAGFALPRLEQLFWRMCSEKTAMNHYLRLFDKRRGTITDMPVHAAPEVSGAVSRTRAPFYHFGEPDIHTKIEKINAYSTGLVRDKQSRGQSAAAWKMLLSPPIAFLRVFVLKRNFLNGWGGFITSVGIAVYAFLKYAKLYEQAQFDRYGRSLLPESAPPHPRLEG